MKYLVVYYSRSGKVEKMANKIANVKKAELQCINDHQNWNGLFGFIKAGFFAMTGKTVKIDPIDVELNDYQQLYLCTPIWAGKLPPAVREFKKLLNDFKGHVTVVYSCQSKEHQNYKVALQKELKNASILGFAEEVHEEMAYEKI
ncbi:flavodoxin family protein [Vallitalea okinawensis]|uniref:flavodoxin family protein n=1 Tax=Vallitalea okinawensis TaxID=2078660 RepID=UPI000CFAB26A|nr:flavodoxin family protein [Vallitalea okinawensis]